MRRVLLLALFLSLFASATYSQTPTPLPVTGNLTQILGQPQAYASVQFQLQNCASPITIPSYYGIVQTQLTLQANSSGLVNGNVWPVDKIDCNGTTGASMYQVTYIVQGVPQGTPQCYQPVSTMGTWNLSSLQPITCTSSPPNPQDAQYQNLVVTNSITLPPIASLALQTLTLTGAMTGTTAAFSGAITAQTVNGIYSVAAFSGSSADVKIAACLAAVPSGGTCDARSFGSGTQSLVNSGALSLPANVTLLCDPATNLNFTGTASSVFSWQTGDTIRGCTVSIPTSYSGTVFAYTGNSSVSNSVLENFTVNGVNNTAATAVGLVSTSSSNAVTAVNVRGGTIHGTQGILLSASGGGWVNGNHISGIWDDQGPYILQEIANGGDVFQNTLDNSQYEYSYLSRTPNMSASGAIYLHGDGTHACSNTVMTGISLWDMASGVPALTFGTGCIHNYFLGTSDGQIAETATSSIYPYVVNNYAWELGNGTLNFNTIYGQNVTARGSGAGYATVTTGDATHTGSVSWYEPSGTRASYCGFDTVGLGLTCTVESGGRFDIEGGLGLYVGGVQVIPPGVTGHVGTGNLVYSSVLSSIRAGTWTITSSTSASVTFSPAMGAAPASCAVNPSGSSATTGQPFATGLSTTGFTVNVPTSGSISGTYQCVANNSN